MKTQPRLSTQSAFQTICHAVRRLLGQPVVQAGIGNDQGSYVGLFQGVIETDAPAAPVSPRPPHRLPATAFSRASGFLRLEVNGQKKATGCFLFFVDGEVLSGAIEGDSDQTGFVDASFRLSPGQARKCGVPVSRPVAAVGKLHLEARHAQGQAAPGENLTIRFV